MKVISLSSFLLIILLCGSCKESEINPEENKEGKCVVLESAYDNYSDNFSSSVKNEYDDKLNPIKISNIGQSYQRIETIVNTYDEANRLLTATNFTEGGIQNYVQSFEYHDNNVLKKKITDSESQIITFEYNEKGKQLKHLQRNKSQDFDFGIKTTAYNANGDVTLEEFIFFNQLQYRTENVYNSANKIINKTIIGSSRININYSYNTEGQLLQEVQNTYLVKDYFYENERLVESIQKNNGQYVRGEKYEYTSDGKVQKISFSTDGKLFLPYLEYTYHPNSNVLSKMVVFSTRDGNLSESMRWQEYTYDRRGNNTQSMTYNLKTGELDIKSESTFQCID